MGTDPSQDRAIFQPIDSSTFVTSPPGYGKTHVMTERIRYLISSKSINPPNKLLALTFSNAAANEMKDRIGRNIPNSGMYVDIMNFHTLAYYILRTYGNYIGVNRYFTILNEEEIFQFKKNYFEEILSDEINENANKLYNIITEYNSWYNKKFLQCKKCEIENEEVFNELRNRIWCTLITKEKLDFDHLLFHSIKLLKKFPIIKNYFFNKYIMILADEFQDTNHVQYLLFKEIATNSDGQKRNVFVVGDKKQAIMKFQGANPENIDLLIKDFGCTELELQKNHRTNSEKILAITKRLRNPEFKVDEGINYKMYLNDTVSEETSRIISIITDLFEKKNVKPQDICILFPQFKTSDPLKKEFDKRSIDYIFINDYKFTSIVSEYSKIFTEIESHIDNEYNEKSVNRIVRELINKYYRSQYENNLVLMTFEKFSRVFDRGDYSSVEVWRRLQDFYNCLQMEIDWTELVRSHIKDRIFLSSIHGSKGLEFKYVLMMGIVNFRLPHHNLCWPCSDFRNRDKVDITEAKDLFYVGVSRAIKNVIFFFSKQDEQNLARTNRKISCVFSDILSLIKFIDSYDGEYGFEENEVQKFLCQNMIKVIPIS